PFGAGSAFGSASSASRFSLPTLARSSRGFGRDIIRAMAEFPIDQTRAAFPALQDGFIFFDNAAGAQSPKTVLDAVANHLLHRNVQRGGRYRQSQEVDEAIAQAR